MYLWINAPWGPEERPVSEIENWPLTEEGKRILDGKHWTIRGLDDFRCAGIYFRYFDGDEMATRVVLERYT